MDKTYYMTNRLHDQISWYDKKSVTNKRYYMGLTILQLTLAGLIVLVLNTPIPVFYSHIIVSILAIGIMIALAICVLYKFEENWIEYRSASETLKGIRFSAVLEGDSDEAFAKRVRRIESIVSRRHATKFTD